MTQKTPTDKTLQVDALYEEAIHWHVNTGDEVIHAKRIPGRFRRLKWVTHALWISFFIGQYFRLDGRQAVLFDIPNRQFHLGSITILPQDVWMLSLLLLFFAILLFVVTAIAGRVFCGYFCFQTVWTDMFTWVEEKIEGAPTKRRMLDNSPWGIRKLLTKGSKHTIWLVLSTLTGISFAGWFTDIYGLWNGLFTLTAAPAAYITVGMFIAGTYILAGHLREQTCFWLCPYARIQGVMYDNETILPAYDHNRGEPRGKLKKGQVESGKGDCIACNQCVAVCPTGIDIREGQQEGCITCALCIDACDTVMDKIDRPRGLIRYASFDELNGKPAIPLFKRPRVLVYFTILLFALSGILYGLTHLGSLELKVLHERQPLFVTQSDGSIQNKYDLKILNKTDRDISVTVTAKGIPAMVLTGADRLLVARAGGTSSFTFFIRAPAGAVLEARTPIIFDIVNSEDSTQRAHYQSMFFSPAR